MGNRAEVAAPWMAILPSIFWGWIQWTVFFNVNWIWFDLTFSNLTSSVESKKKLKEKKIRSWLILKITKQETEMTVCVCVCEEEHLQMLIYFDNFNNPRIIMSFEVKQNGFYSLSLLFFVINFHYDSQQLNKPFVNISQIINLSFSQKKKKIKILWLISFLYFFSLFFFFLIWINNLLSINKFSAKEKKKRKE